VPVTIERLTKLVPNSEDYGRMAFVGSDLLAILIRTDEERFARRWSVEWIAPVITAAPPTFTRLAAARRWLSCEFRKTAHNRHH
jgi:hypothetical protein